VGQATTGKDAGSIAAYLALAALAAFGYYVFPGHTWLQQDSQIYVAIFEHLRDPAVLAADPVATHPHVTYTLFDEVALGLRQAFGLDFHTSLAAQQLVLRWAGLVGMYLLALRLGMNAWGAVFASALFGFGSSIFGPAVLTVEYEPVPRGFAVPLLLLAGGLAARERWGAAGLAAALATLYHPPTTAPFWAAAILTAAVALRDARARRLLWPLAAAAVILYLAAQFQRGELEPQVLFGSVDAGMERLLRWRAPYNWLSQWHPYWLIHYPLLGVFCALALWRLNRLLAKPVLWLIAGLIGIGLLSMALQYVFLEKVRWSLIASFQPGRGVLFAAAFAPVLGAATAWHSQSWLARWLWLTPAFLLPTLPGWGARSALVGIGLAAVAAALIRMPKLLPTVAVAAALLYPTLGGVVNYPSLHTPELKELSDWARQNTPPQAVFFFAGAYKDLAPGIFRVEAQRAIYVDWKGGGQVNLLHGFALEWWRRWHDAHPATFHASDVPALRALGIDYLVLPPQKAPPDAPLLFRNAKYVVVRD